MRGTWTGVVAALVLALPLVAGAQETTTAATPFLAKPGGMGLGLGGGTLTSGLSGKYYVTERLAAQALVGFWAGLGLSAGVDAIYEMPPLFSNQQFSVHWYAGGGPSAGFYNTLGVSGGMFALSAVGGAALQLKDYPVEVTAELRPTYLLNSFIGGFYFGGGGAVRYYFGNAK